VLVVFRWCIENYLQYLDNYFFERVYYKIRQASYKIFFGYLRYKEWFNLKAGPGACTMSCANRWLRSFAELRPGDRCPIIMRIIRVLVAHIAGSCSRRNCRSLLPALDRPLALAIKSDWDGDENTVVIVGARRLISTLARAWTSIGGGSVPTPT
jgi:hypothetical protein